MRQEQLQGIRYLVHAMEAMWLRLRTDVPTRGEVQGLSLHIAMQQMHTNAQSTGSYTAQLCLSAIAVTVLQEHGPGIVSRQHTPFVGASEKRL